MNHSHHETPHTDGMVIHWAKFYDLVMKTLSFGRERNIRRKMLAVAALKEGERVLDVGCGTGTLALAAADEVGANGKVYGVDPAPEMVARAQAKAEKQGKQVQFQIGIVEALDFPDQSLDVVLSTLVFHHLPDDQLQQKALIEIRRVLSPGGRLVLVDFGVSKLIDRLADKVAEAGFDSIKTSRLGPRVLFSLTARRSLD